VQQTLQNVPQTLQEAATSDDPTKTVPRAISTIRQRLMDEVQDADTQLMDAVQSYVDNLQAVATEIRSGRQPDLSKLTTSSIDDVCANVNASVTVSPSPTS
jgi:hypothetical protein